MSRSLRNGMWRRHSCLRVAEGDLVAVRSEAPPLVDCVRVAECRNARLHGGAFTTARSWLALAACSLGALPAHAHLMNTGLGPFYDGVLHALATPGDLLLLLALALFAGLRGADSGRTMLFVVPTAWLAGGLAGLQAGFEISAPVVAAVVLAGAGGLVAADVPAPRSLVAVMGAGAGALHGVMNGSAMAATGAGGRGLAGIACTAFIVVALVAATGVKLGSGPTRIVLRVAGSWIAAIALLMLGWTMRAAA